MQIVHAAADLGSLAEGVRAAHVQRRGEHGWDAHVTSVQGMWHAIRAAIDRLDVEPASLRLYQDGLPHCGREVEIVRDLACAGSPNHQLLLDLMNRGAQLTGTEAPDLLLEEYALAQQTLTRLGRPGAPEAGPLLEDRARQLLHRRDSAMARRIDATLRPGETGLIFLGLLHDLRPHLPADIQPGFLLPLHGPAPCAQPGAPSEPAAT